MSGRDKSTPHVARLAGAAAALSLAFALAASAQGDGAFALSDWQKRDGAWNVDSTTASASGGFAKLISPADAPADCDVSADVSVSHDEPHAAAGLAVRLADDGSGYAVAFREVEKGATPQFGPWEHPVVQLYRWDKDGWKLLQESKVSAWRYDQSCRLRVVCRGPNIWVYVGDNAPPTLTEFDDAYVRAGRVGLWKDNLGAARFANVALAAATADLAPPPLRFDWSNVRRAVYVRSSAVNSVQMWHDYWDHTAEVDRELSYAADYGFNMIQVYLHWIVWDDCRDDYLKRIDDFLARAAKYKLKVNFVLWDDCGTVEPSLTFKPPVPGRHNFYHAQSLASHSR